MVENRRRTIKNKYTLGLDFGSLNRRAVLVSVKEDS
jgi:activator of 2-hydroxyglutaryl-CoA dehydratase